MNFRFYNHWTCIDREYQHFTLFAIDHTDMLCDDGIENTSTWVKNIVITILNFEFSFSW
jgi:hypothetical protein